MKKLFRSLPFRLLMAIALGIGLGLILPDGAMTEVVTVRYILSQLIGFCVPLIIIGFIAPSITRLGSGATRMLAVAVGIAYLSSLLASCLSMLGGCALIPRVAVSAGAEGLRTLPDVAFQLDIPQIMPVMSALVFSILIGVAAVWTRAERVTGSWRSSRRSCSRSWKR